RLGTLIRIARTALLIIDGDNRAGFPFDQIHFGDQPMGFAAQGDRSRMDVRLLVRWRQWVRLGFELLVAQFTLYRVGAVGENSFHPFVEKKARTIDEFVEHPR